MAKKMWNVTADLSESLCHVCPNCGGTLNQRRDYSLECEDCGNRINIETKKEFYTLWCFVAFVAGALFAVLWIIAWNALL